MRNNQPVTQREVSFADDTLIISRTDLQGNITQVNHAFVEISGFSEAELIGKPHNILRHPDMPPEAYVDFWTNLKQGRPWTGLVKNRCKNGDHYWVVANAAPVLDNGRVSGYMSVRQKPTRQQIEAADHGYRLFTEGKAKGLKISQGKIIKNTLVWRAKNMLLKFKIGARLAGMIGLGVLVAVLLAAQGYMGLNASQQSLKTV